MSSRENLWSSVNEHHFQKGSEYQPIKFGSLKFVICFLLVMIGFAVYPTCFSAWSDGPIFNTSYLKLSVFWICSILGLGHIVYWLTGLLDGKLEKLFPFDWLSRYWKYNLRGYTLWFFHNRIKDSEINWLLSGREEMPSLRLLEKSVGCDFVNPVVFIGVPIGGMFRSQKNLIAYRKDGMVVARNTWKLKFIGVERLSGPTILVRDNDDGSMRVLLSNFLGNLQKDLDKHGYAYVGSWSDILYEVQAAELNQRQHRISLLFDTINMLDQTRRFIHSKGPTNSKEARGIRAWLAEQLDELLPPYDSKRIIIAKPLPIVEDMANSVDG